MRWIRLLRGRPTEDADERHTKILSDFTKPTPDSEWAPDFGAHPIFATVRDQTKSHKQEERVPFDQLPESVARLLLKERSASSDETETSDLSTSWQPLASTADDQRDWI